MPASIRKYLPAIYGGFYNLLSYWPGLLAGKVAFRTFSKVRKGRVLPEQMDYLERAKHNELIVNGHSIQTYRWPGKGERVLLVHGWESNSFRWKKLIGQLRQQDFEVWAFDAPGHGYSSGQHFHVPLYSDCLWQMINTCQPRHVVAHSIGGLTTLFTHYRYMKTGVDKIVTIGSPSEFSELMEQYRSLLKLNKRVMQALDEYVFSRFGFRIHEFSAARFAPVVSQKGLVIHDKQDPTIPFGAAEEVHASWEGSTLLATEGFGHSMHQDEVNLQILDFLKT